MDVSIPEFRKVSMDHWEEIFLSDEKPIEFHVLVHDIPFCFRIKDLNLAKQLAAFFPFSWQSRSHNPVVVEWIKPVSPNLNIAWDSISSPDCHFVDDFVSQRDFLARKLSDRYFQLMAPYKIDDGLFNFLRYLLPLKLLELNKVVFHSSCVVEVWSQKPYLFFGPSGAGKTTIAGLCSPGGNVLGDDMNLLSFEDGRVFIEAATLGQRIYNVANFGRKFEINRAFWLVQSHELGHTKIEEGGSRYLLSSVANLFWDQLDDQSYQKVFKLLGHLKSQLHLYELNFPKNNEVWKYVRSI